MDKIEHWRHETFIGRKDTNANYWGQYELLVKFIIENYKGRFETISAPLLHIISHSLELAYKENLKYFSKYNNITQPIIFNNLNDLYKSHELRKLHDEFYFQVKETCNLFKVTQSILDEFEKLCKIAVNLLDTIKVTNETFRYSEKINREGVTIGNIFSNNESINIYEINVLYKEVSMLLLHTNDVLSIYTDYIDYIKVDNSIEKKGFGWVLFSLPEFSKDIIIKKFNKEYKRIKENEIWYDDNEKYEVHLKLLNGNYYAIPLKKVVLL